MPKGTMDKAYSKLLTIESLVDKDIEWAHEKTSLTMNGNLQTIVELTGEATWCGDVFLDNMAEGDTITIAFFKKKEGGTYVQFYSVTYNDAQTEGGVSIQAEIFMYGLKITIQQTAGSYKAVEIHRHKRL